MCDLPIAAHRYMVLTESRRYTMQQINRQTYFGAFPSAAITTIKAKLIKNITNDARTANRIPRNFNAASLGMSKPQIIFGNIVVTLLGSESFGDPILAQ